jgi:hypothetical protein
MSRRRQQQRVRLRLPSATPAQEGGGGGHGGGGSSEQSSEPLNGLNEKAINDIIKEHNLFRAKEHVPPLT